MLTVKSSLRFILVWLLLETLFSMNILFHLFDSYTMFVLRLQHKDQKQELVPFRVTLPFICCIIQPKSNLTLIPPSEAESYFNNRWFPSTDPNITSNYGDLIQSINSGLQLLTEMPNCSRAMRMTSVVLSVLLTASVLAWWKHDGKYKLFGLLLISEITHRSTDCAIKLIFVLMEAIKSHRERRGALHMHSFRYLSQRSSEEWSSGRLSLYRRRCDCLKEEKKSVWRNKRV